MVSIAEYDDEEWKTRNMDIIRYGDDATLKLFLRGETGTIIPIPVSPQTSYIPSAISKWMSPNNYVHVLWLSSSEKFSSTVLMMNDNTICGASVEEYSARLKEDEQQAVNIRNNFNVNVMMVYYRGYVMYMQKK